MKSVFFAISMLTFGCSTLPRAGVDYVTPLSERGRPGALVSGPAILHLNSRAARAAVSIYLADDSGARGDSCPTSAADTGTPILVMKDAAHVSDVPIPGGKRACVRFEQGGDMSVSWFAEVSRRWRRTEVPRWGRTAGRWGARTAAWWRNGASQQGGDS